MFRSYRERLLAPGEPVRHVTHPHWFSVFGQTLWGLIILLAMIAGIIALQFLDIFPTWFQSYRPIAAMALGSIASVILIVQIFHWLRWRSHEIVVTDRRVIRNHRHFFERCHRLFSGCHQRFTASAELAWSRV